MNRAIFLRAGFSILLAASTAVFADNPNNKQAAKKPGPAAPAKKPAVAANANKTAATSKPATAAAAKPAESPLDTLRKAYSTLSRADHDYDGHRVAAMKDIAEAASALGTDLSGEGAGGEPQTLSDLQIRSVQMMLQGVGRKTPAGEKRESIIGPVHSAIRELTLALQLESGKGGETVTAKVVEEPANASDALASNTLEIDSLARIYGILATGNHNYQGHRVAAMQAIQHAAGTLGRTLSGDGGAGLDQKISDDLLHQAQDLLEQVQASFDGDDHASVRKDLDTAVNQLSIALSIK
jgi:hypothetical protein